MDADPQTQGLTIDEIVTHRVGSPHKAAMRVCEVTDTDNSKTFTNYEIQFANKHRLNMMWEIIEAFWGELKHGEHKNVRNKAAVLSQRFKKALNTLPSF